MSTDLWQTMPLNVLDFETTGVDVMTDRIVQAAYVEFPDTSQGPARPVAHQWLVDPGVEIPDGAAAVHGITTERARAEGMAPDVALFELAGRIALGLGRGVPLVVYNAAYDLTLLEVELARHGVDTIASRLPRGWVRPIVDPFVIDKKISRRKGPRKLVNLCEHYRVVHIGAHDAAGDAIATGRLARRVMAKAADYKRDPGMERWQLNTLHQAQVGWRREQMDSLRAYFDREGKEHDGCDGGWPLQDRYVRALAGERVA